MLISEKNEWKNYPQKLAHKEKQKMQTLVKQNTRSTVNALIIIINIIIMIIFIVMMHGQRETCSSIKHFIVFFLWQQMYQPHTFPSYELPQLMAMVRLPSIDYPDGTPNHYSSELHPSCNLLILFQMGPPWLMWGPTQRACFVPCWSAYKYCSNCQFKNSMATAVNNLLLF